MSDLAIDGGAPVRQTPFPARTPFGDREVELVTEAIRSQNLFGSTGPVTARFEQEFAQLYGATYATASTSGTAAIHVALGAINPAPGDEIITAPITDAGSIIPILYQNAVPVFADVDETLNMDPESIEANITERTAAIMVIHLFGNPADMDGILEVAGRHGIPVIEDCSQSHLTRYKGRLLGTMGTIAAFSLQQSKHMTTGDGGVTITSDPELGERMRYFRDKGWIRGRSGERMYAFLGMNYRITELQSAVGIAQLEKVTDVVRRRNEAGEAISAAIADAPGVRPLPVTEGASPTYWFYPLEVTRGSTDDFASALTAEGLPAAARYTGIPIYLCMAALTHGATFGDSAHPLDGCHGARVMEYRKGICPRAEAGLGRLVSVPLNENWTLDDAADAAAAINKVAAGLASR